MEKSLHMTPFNTARLKGWSAIRTVRCNFITATLFNLSSQNISLGQLRTKQRYLKQRLLPVLILNIKLHPLGFILSTNPTTILPPGSCHSPALPPSTAHLTLTVRICKNHSTFAKRRACLEVHRIPKQKKKRLKITIVLDVNLTFIHFRSTETLRALRWDYHQIRSSYSNKYFY